MVKDTLQSRLENTHNLLVEREDEELMLKEMQ